MAAEEIYDFMRDQNRPFVINEIIQNISKDHGKTAVQKALEKLVAQNKIMEKGYGKQKVFCVSQPDKGTTSENEETLRKLEQDISAVSNQAKSFEEQLMKTSEEVRTLQRQITTEDAKLQNQTLSEEISRLKERLEGLQQNATPITDEEKSRITSENAHFLKEYKKRKRTCLEMTDAILEGYPKTKKDLFEEISIETDEEVGFKLA